MVTLLKIIPSQSSLPPQALCSGIHPSQVPICCSLAISPSWGRELVSQLTLYQPEPFLECEAPIQNPWRCPPHLEVLCEHRRVKWFNFKYQFFVQVQCREQSALSVEYSQPRQLPPAEIHLHRRRAKWGDNPAAPGHTSAPDAERDSDLPDYQWESRLP